MTNLEGLLRRLNDARSNSLLPIVADCLEDMGDRRSDGLRWLCRERLRPHRSIGTGTWTWYWSNEGCPRAWNGCLLPKDVFDLLEGGIRCSPYAPSSSSWKTTETFAAAMMTAAHAYSRSGRQLEALTFRLLVSKPTTHLTTTGRYLDAGVYGSLGLCGVLSFGICWEVPEKNLTLKEIPATVCKNCQRHARRLM